MSKNETMTWEEVARDLFDLLDDIDTADDIAKSDENFYRNLVRSYSKRRFDYGVTDGLLVDFPRVSNAK